MPDDAERLVAHGSFFQLKNVRDAITAGTPQSLIVHEDLIAAAYHPQQADGR